MEGYIFTATPAAALDAFHLFDEIRYHAHLDDHSGFAAFDLYHPHMTEFGDVRMIDPNAVWPGPVPQFPKRGYATPDDWFARIPYDEATAAELYRLNAVTGLALIEGGELLVESHGPVIVQSDGLNAKAVHFEQRRVRQPA